MEGQNFHSYMRYLYQDKTMDDVLTLYKPSFQINAVNKTIPAFTAFTNGGAQIQRLSPSNGYCLLSRNWEAELLLPNSNETMSISRSD